MILRRPSRRYMIFALVFALAVCLAIGETIGLQAHLSIRDLFIMGLLAIGISIAVWALIYWLLFRFVFPRLGYANEAAVTAQAAKESSIEYELGQDDILAFHEYLFERSLVLGQKGRVLRRLVLIVLALELLTVVAVAIFLGRDSQTFLVVLGTVLLLTLLYYLASPLVFRIIIKATVASQYEKRLDKLIGKHKLYVKAEGVTDIASLGQSTANWKAVQRIESTGRYLFILVRGSGPHIVPRGAFADEASFNQFIASAKAYYQAS